MMEVEVSVAWNVRRADASGMSVGVFKEAEVFLGQS